MSVYARGVVLFEILASVRPSGPSDRNAPLK